MKGINKVDLGYVLDFLYNGEAYIAQEELNNFLDTAQELQMKGLQPNHQDARDNRNTAETKLYTETQFNVMKETEDTLHQESILDSLEELADSFDNSKDVILIPTEEDDLEKLNIELDLRLEQMIQKNEKLWHCKLCGKRSKQKSHIKQHAEVHIEGLTHSCHVCSKTSATRHSLRLHMSISHSEVSTSTTCRFCGKTGLNKNALRNHKFNGCLLYAVK